MDPPIINESSFSAANPSSYSLTEICTFSINGGGDPTSGLRRGGGLGLRMGNLNGFVEATVNRTVSVDEPTMTEQSDIRGAVEGVSVRKRRDLNSEDESSKLVSATTCNGLNDWNGQRLKVFGSRYENGIRKAEVKLSSVTANKSAEQGRKTDEPPKDYIHVRARRGQATDSHSLAERARREKISERMKILQDLVPGCNKVIGKALVLEEIIKYIQSLQRQVEFLSMKLETVNSRMNPAIDGFAPKYFGASSYDTTGIIFGSQAPREYTSVTQHEWLHM